MATQPLYNINGVIDTDETVWDNILKIGFACAIWPTFNTKSGKWELVINQADTPVYEITDNNIIGSITVIDKPYSEMYNSVQVGFPHKDLLDERDFVRFDLSTADYGINENNNALSLETDLVNDPIQAEYLAAIELNQSRQQTIIEFSTDFSTMELTAGDIISVTSAVYGWSQKEFRIVSISEADTSNGNIILSYVCIEYDAAIYSGYPLGRFGRSRNTNIIPKTLNTDIKNKENDKAVNSVTEGANRNPDAFNSVLGNALRLTREAEQHGLILYFDQTTQQYLLSFRGSQTLLEDTSDIAITWTFLDGQDLDIRARIVSPNVGMGSTDVDGDGFVEPAENYVGYTFWFNTQWPRVSNDPYIRWAGDNVGTGVESVLVNIRKLQEDFPSNRYIIVECRGNWYVRRGLLDTQLQAVLYRGGNFFINNFAFTNTNYQDIKFLAGIDVKVNSLDGFDPVTGQPVGNANGEFTTGDLMGYLLYDTQTGFAEFVNDISPYI